MARVIFSGDATLDMLDEDFGLTEAQPIVILTCSRSEASVLGKLLYQRLQIGKLYSPGNPEQAGGPTTELAGVLLRARPEEESSP